MAGPDDVPQTPGSLVGPGFVEDLIRWKRTIEADLKARIHRLERQLESIGAKEVRFATTVGYNPATETENASFYPNEPANTFWVKLGAPSYTDSAGFQTLSVSAYDPPLYRLVHSTYGAYIPIGTDIPIQLMHGQYYTMEPGVWFFIFQLTEAFTDGTANAHIIRMNEVPRVLQRTLRDPLGIFSSLGIGDTGIGFYQYGNYYAIQAPCPEDSTPIIPL